MDSQSTDQLEPQTNPADSKRSGLLGWFLWPVMLLLIYILSMGPAFSLGRRYTSFSTRLTLYSPIFYLCNTPPTSREMHAVVPW